MALNVGELYGKIGMDLSPLDKALDKAKDTIKGFGTDGTKLAIGAGVLIGAGLAAAVAKGIDLEPAKDKLAAQLGATGADAEKYGKAASAAYAKGWGESMDDATAATAAVATSIKGMRNASEPELAAMTEKVMIFSETMEVDVARAAQVAGQMVNSGLVDNASYGLDLLMATLQRVPVAVRDDVMDAVDEYGPFFTQMGIKGDQAMAMLAKGAEKGMYGIDKTGDAVKEFTIRATDMSKATTDAYAAIGLDAQKMTNELLAGGDRGAAAMDQIVKGILNIKDPAAQSQAALALFGTPLEDLGTNDIPKFLEGLTATSDSLGDVAGAVDEAGATLAGNPQANITQFTRSLEILAVDVIGGKVVPYITMAASWLNTHLVPGLMAAGQWVQDNSGWLGALASALGVAALALAAVAVQQKIVAAGGLLQFIKGVITSTKLWSAAQWALNAAMRANPIGIIITLLAALGAAIVWLWNNNEGFRNAVIAVWNAIKAGVGAVVDWFTSNVLPALVAVWEGIKAAFGAAVDWVGSVFSAAWGFIKDWIVAPLVAAFNMYVQIWQWIFNGFMAAASWVGSVFKAAWDVLGPIITFPIELGWKIIQAVFILLQRGFMAVAGWVGTVFKAAWDLIQTYLIAPVQAAWNGIVQVWNWILATFSAAWAWVSGVFMAQWRLLTGLIGDVMATVQRGIQIAWDRIMGIFQAAWNWVTTVFRGLWNQFTELMERPIALARDAIRRVLDGIQEFFRLAVAGIGRIWDGLREVASRPVRFVIDTVINNGIVKGWNDLVGLLKLPDDLRIQPLNVPGFESGGVLPGQARGRGDNLLVVDGAGRPVSTIRSGEGIIPAGVTAAYQRAGILDQIIKGGGLPAFFLGGTMPVPPGRISQHRSGYGSAQWAGDLARPMGTPVAAWKAGTVASTARLGTSYGWHVWLNHPGNQRSLYAHLSRIDVNAGQAVAAGQRIGLVGSTGNSTGPHLHFEVRGGQAVPAGDTGGGEAGGGIMDMALQWITDKLGTPVRALIDRIPGAGLFLDAAKGMGTKLLDAVTEKIKSLMPSFGDSGPGVPITGSVQQVATALMNAGKQMNVSRHAMKLALMTAFQESSMQPDHTTDSNGDAGLFQNRPGRGDGTIAQLNDPYYALRLFLFGKQMGGWKLPGLYDQRGWQDKVEWQAIAWVQRPYKPYEPYYQRHAGAAENLLRGFNGTGYRWGTINATRGWHAVGDGGEPELVLPGSSLRYFSGGERVLRAGAGLGGDTNFYYQPKVSGDRDPRDEFDDAMFNFKHKVQTKMGAAA